MSETKFDPPFRIDPASSHFAASLETYLDAPIDESLNRSLTPEVVPEPPADAHERSQRHKLLWRSGGVAAAFGLSAAIALIVVTVLPSLRDHGNGSEAEINPPRRELQSPLASDESDRPMTQEKSKRLLEQFMRWHQKAAFAQHQQ
ncbi:hypothetical protein [Bradyrhizobium sp. Tv2a-2]|uniref:hypothetical protein n=1 Tax=Bradyrhizobium sp. Tv2a-2 TaxID=113395 RepID=UPI0012EC0BFE|nr:hypothetical protein [Bradyrhizobium sp. Tv2a-2]